METSLLLGLFSFPVDRLRTLCMIPKVQSHEVNTGAVIANYRLLAHRQSIEHASLANNGMLDEVQSVNHLGQ